MNKVDIVVNEAKKLLKENPFDVGHDLSHHTMVWRLAKRITKNIDEKIDMDALKTECLWHDVVVTKLPTKDVLLKTKMTDDSLEYLVVLLKKYKFSKEFINKVVIAKKYHHFDEKPRSVEGKILWDADKLGVLGLNRWQRFIQAEKNGKIPKSFVSYYASTFKEKYLKTMRNRLHFKYSKILHDEMILRLIKSKEGRATAKRFSWDLKSALPK